MSGSQDVVEGGVTKKRTTRPVESVEACLLWCDIPRSVPATWEALEAAGNERVGQKLEARQASRKIVRCSRR